MAGSSCPSRVNRPTICAGNAIPTSLPVPEPVESSIERNRTSVRNPVGAQVGDGTPEDAATDNFDRMLIAAQTHVDPHSGQQAIAGFDQDPGRRDVDDPQIVPGTNPGRLKIAVAGAKTAMGSSVGSVGHHDGFHCRDTASNRRTRVFPVSPEIRITYCKSRRTARPRLMSRQVKCASLIPKVRRCT